MKKLMVLACMLVAVDAAKPENVSSLISENFGDPKLNAGTEVAEVGKVSPGKRTSFSYVENRIGILNARSQNGYVYLGDYYTTAQLDSLFGRRINLEDRYDYVAYEYDDCEFISMTTDMGMTEFILNTDSSKVLVEGMTIVVGSRTDSYDFSAFKKEDEKKGKTGEITTWYNLSRSDMLLLKQKNGMINYICVSMDF